MEVFWQKGERTKTTPEQNLPDKTPEQKPHEPLREISVQGAFVRTFCTSKNREVRGVTKCDRGRRKVKIGQK